MSAEHRRGPVIDLEAGASHPARPTLGLVVRVMRALTVGGTAAFVVTRLPPLRAELPRWVTAGLIVGVSAIATALVVLRSAFVVRHRMAWGMLAAGVATSCVATGYSWGMTGGVVALPFPSRADVGWLLLYPLAGVGVGLLIRVQVARPRTRVMLDGLVAGLGAAALLSAVRVEVLVLPAETDRLLTAGVSFAYTIGDALLIGLAACLFAVGGRDGRRNNALLIASLLTFAVADTVYLTLASRSAYQPGDIADSGYLLAFTLMGLAAWRQGRRASGPGDMQTSRSSLPPVLAVSCLALLIAAAVVGMSLIPIALAGTALTAVVASSLVSFHEIRTMALHDSLTGLPNRALIADRLEHLLARSRRTNHEAAALFLDLDGFKEVNDTLGHDVGDQLLRAAAKRLSITTRDADTLGRMGGDEFVVLVDGSGHAAPELVAERILDVMRHPFDLAGTTRPISVTASIGIACGDRAHAGDVLRDADIALYRAKADGKDCFRVFQPAMQLAIRPDDELLVELGSALERDQFRLEYQPIYDLTDLSLINVEALLRWDHPTLGSVPPDRFVPLLHRNGATIEIGRWVLMHACRQMRRWHDAGSDLTLSVNVSVRQLGDDRVVDHVIEALSLSGLDPASLMLEIPEAALVTGIPATTQRLCSLKELGVKIAINDFGTGYSSLLLLQKFPVDCLKLDRAFTGALIESAESRAIVHTLVQLGRDLDLTTMAAGVETSGQLDQLRREHVDGAQGFLLSRPLTPEDFEDKLLFLHGPRLSPLT